MSAARQLNHNIPPVIESPDEIDHDGSITLFRYYCPQCQQFEQIPGSSEWLAQATAAEQAEDAKRYHDFRVHGVGVSQAVSPKRAL